MPASSPNVATRKDSVMCLTSSAALVSRSAKKGSRLICTVKPLALNWSANSAEKFAGTIRERMPRSRKSRSRTSIIAGVAVPILRNFFWYSERDRTRSTWACFLARSISRSLITT